MFFIFSKNFSIFVHNEPLRMNLLLSSCFVILHPPCLASVLCCMTVSTEQLQVLVVECYLRMIDVHRSDFNLMMNNLSRFVYALLQTVLTKMMNLLCVFVPAVLPCLRTVKALCELFRHYSTSKCKRTPEDVPD